MEFKRTNSSKGLLSRRNSVSTPTLKSSPIRVCSARRATSSAELPTPVPMPAPAAPPLPPATHHTRVLSGRNTGRTSSRKRSGDFERSNSATGSRNTFRRSNSIAGLKKAEVMKSNNRVNVYARVRAFGPDEWEGSAAELAVQMTDDTVEVKVPKKGKFTFSFDGCFWSNDRPCPSGKKYSSQEEVFDEIGRPLVENALSGYNAAVLAYGQTGSGKTYTAFGPVGSLGTANEGLIPRVCNMIFTRAEQSAQKGVTYTVRASMLEVYLEDVFDLLNHRKELTVRNDYATNGFSVVGATSVAVKNYGDVFTLLNKAEPLRTFASTNIHDRSSRAHTLFFLEVQTHFDSKELQPRCANILLADLAGSERIRLAGTEEGLKFEQARNINLSLLALGCCIEAVAMRGKADVSEFRHSTLTKLLKDYIGGNSVSTMIVTVGPGSHHANLSVQSLRFADRAKQVASHAIVNTVDPNARKRDCANISDRLREEYLRKKEALYAEYQLMSTIEKLIARIAELEDRIRDCTNDELLKHLNLELEELQSSLTIADGQLLLQRQILYGQYLALEDELRDLNERMHEMRAEHEEAMEAMLGEESGRFEEMRRTHVNRIDVLTRQLGDKEAECTNALDEIERLKRLVAELESKLRAKEEECEGLQGDLASLQGRFDTLTEESNDKITDLSEQLESLRCLLAQTEETAEADRTAATNQCDALNGTIDELRADVSRMVDDLAQKEEHFETVHAEQQAAIERIMAELEQVKKLSATEEAKLTQQLQETEVKLQETEDALYGANEDIQEKDSMIESLHADLEENKAQLAHKEELLQAKASEATNLAEDMGAMKEHLEGEMAIVQHSLGVSTRECESRDVCLDAFLHYVRRSYAITLDAFSAQVDLSMEEFLNETEEAFFELSDKAAREAARFVMLRKVLGKIDEDVKNANEEIEAPENTSPPVTGGRSARSQLRDVSNRENSVQSK